MNYTHPSKVIRRLLVDTAGTYTVTTVDENYFSSELVTPDQSGTRTNGPSPREQPRYLLRWHSEGILAPHSPALDPGERVQVGTVVYELVSAPRQIGVPMTEKLFEAELVPVEELYPYVGSLQQFDGTVIQASLRFSAYSNDETHEDQGTYENFSGEAAISDQAVLTLNKQIVAGSNKYKIVSAETDNEGNFIRLELRRAGG